MKHQVLQNIDSFFLYFIEINKSVFKDFQLPLCKKKIRNATRCTNQDDLLYVSFMLKISKFSEAYLGPSQKSMMQFFAKILSG